MTLPTLGIDAYQLTTLLTHADEGRLDHEVTMAFFFRRMPKNRGYVVFSGLRRILEHASQMSLDESELDTLESHAAIGPALRARPEVVAHLRALRGFHGSIDAMPEGSVAFAGPASRTDGTPLVGRRRAAVDLHAPPPGAHRPGAREAPRDTVARLREPHVDGRLEGGARRERGERQERHGVRPAPDASRRRARCFVGRMGGGHPVDLERRRVRALGHHHDRHDGPLRDPGLRAPGQDARRDGARVLRGLREDVRRRADHDARRHVRHRARHPSCRRGLSGRRPRRDPHRLERHARVDRARADAARRARLAGDEDLRLRRARRAPRRRAARPRRRLRHRREHRLLAGRGDRCRRGGEARRQRLRRDHDEGRARYRQGDAARRAPGLALVRPRPRGARPRALAGRKRSPGARAVLAGRRPARESSVRADLSLAREHCRAEIAALPAELRALDTGRRARASSSPPTRWSPRSSDLSARLGSAYGPLDGSREGSRRITCHEAHPHRRRERQHHGRRRPLERRPRRAPRTRGRGRRRDHRRAERAAHRRLLAGGPRPLARVRRRAVGRARALREGDGRPRRGVRDRRSPSRAARTSTTRRRWCTRGKILGIVPKEKLPDVQRLLRGARLRARLPGPRRRRARRARSATSSSISTSRPSASRSARTSGRRTARCAGARTRAPRSSSTCRPRRSASASSRRAAR